MTFDKFTLKAQEAVAKAQQLASEREQQQIDVEHLLRVMLDDSEGVPSSILKKLGANEKLISDRLDEALQKLPKVSGSGALGNVYISNRVNKIFSAAMKEMRQLKDEYISTEHILIVMADEKDGTAGDLLRQQA